MPTVHEWNSHAAAVHREFELPPGRYALADASERTSVFVKLYPVAPQTDDDKELHARIFRDAEADGAVWALARTGPGAFELPSRAMVSVRTPADGGLKVTSEE